MNNIEGLVRFVESANIDHRLIKKAENNELKESLSRCSQNIKFKESLDATEGWWVPVSFYNKVNGNNRNYSKKLWENVINNQKDVWKGSPMLEDHPQDDSDGNPRDICGVWLDAKLDPPDRNGEGLVWGLLIPSGRLGDDLKDHLKNGLKIGTSSSGFGQLMSDGVTVDPDTYTIERLADFVLNPSQGTFFSYDESDDNIEDSSIRESAHNTFNESNKVKEITMRDSKIAKLEEKKFRKDMESFLEDANNIRDPQERLEEFKEIRSFLEEGVCPDLKEKIEAKIANEEAEIKKMISDGIEMREELGIKDPQDLKEKITRISEEASILEKESRDWKAISERLQSKYTSLKKDLENRPTNAYASYLEDKNNKLTEQLRSQNQEAYSIIKNLTEAYKKLKETNVNQKKQIETLTFEKEKLNEACEEIQLNGKAKDKKFDDFAESTDLLKQELRETRRNNMKLLSVIKSQRVALEKAAIKNESFSKLNREKSRSLTRLMNETKGIQRQLDAEVDEREAIERDLSMSSVDEYYESLYNTYGNQILPFKEKILRAKTLAEAKRLFFQDILGNLRESKRIDKTRIPQTMYISENERKATLGEENFERTSMIDRKPDGWV